MRISLKEADKPCQAIVELSPLEIRALRAAIGEVCFGFDVPDFNVQMGSTKNEAQELFGKMDWLSSDRQNEIKVTRRHLREVSHVYLSEVTHLIS